MKKFILGLIVIGIIALIAVAMGVGGDPAMVEVTQDIKLDLDK